VSEMDSIQEGPTIEINLSNQIIKSDNNHISENIKSQQNLDIRDFEVEQLVNNIRSLTFSKTSIFES
jgi:hypothetical protein